MASKLRPQQADNFFCRGAMEISENLNFFYYSGRTRKSSKRFFFVFFTESLRTQDFKCVYKRGLTDIFVRLKSGEGGKMQVVSKIKPV